MSKSKKESIQVPIEIFQQIETLSKDRNIIKIGSELSPLLQKECMNLEVYFSNEHIILSLVIDYFSRGGDTTKSNYIITEAIKLAVQEMNEL